jgi:hypothetical protein
MGRGKMSDPERNKDRQTDRQTDRKNLRDTDIFALISFSQNSPTRFHQTDTFTVTKRTTKNLNK